MVHLHPMVLSTVSNHTRGLRPETPETSRDNARERYSDGSCQVTSLEIERLSWTALMVTR